MKFKNLFKVLFVLAIAVTTIIVAESQDVKVTNEAKADCPVDEGDINSYLVAHGYQAVSIAPIYGSQNWFSQAIGGQTQEYFLVTVYVTGCIITGHSAQWCSYCPY